MSSDPSKISGQWHSTKGGLKSGLGNVTRSSNLQSSGRQERAQGQAEYEAARGQGYPQNPQGWNSGGNTESATQDYLNQSSNQGYNKDPQGWSGGEKRESAVLGSDQGIEPQVLQSGQALGTARQDYKDASQQDVNRDDFTR